MAKSNPLDYDKKGDRFVLSFSTAVSPTQLYTVEGKDRETIVMHTEERILGIPESLLSKGEDASFTSHDGMRISARLYLPANELGYKGPRPVVYYIHGGPQSQERPDFAWFSMPLIQFLTLRGFRGICPQRARLQRVWIELHETGRQGLGWIGPAGSCARDDQGPEQG